MLLSYRRRQPTSSSFWMTVSRQATEQRETTMDLWKCSMTAPITEEIITGVDDNSFTEHLINLLWWPFDHLPDQIRPVHGSHEQSSQNPSVSLASHESPYIQLRPLPRVSTRHSQMSLLPSPNPPSSQQG